MGDDWVDDIEDAIGQTLTKAADLDDDGLKNLQEFRWNLLPICHAALGQNCKDKESSTTTGFNGDSWEDGSEVKYWNDPENDSFGSDEPNKAFFDPDRFRDIDGDGRVDTRDKDADGDGMHDGVEYNTYNTYPEFQDSDCSTTTNSCTRSNQTTYTGSRTGEPGTGDGIRDNQERAAWASINASAWNIDYDHDGIANNLLDPDSDNDGLLDGEEFLQGGGQAKPYDADTDDDGVLDGDETQWYADSDNDGLRNVNDPDSDGDGMPDGWERQYGFNRVSAADAGQDRDGDGLSNLAEYQSGTDPTNMDTDGDLLLDGAEVNTHGTDPLWWDSDSDGIPDYVEVQANLNPLNSGDASLDADGDSYDAPGDGIAAVSWTNLKEYQYQRPEEWDEEDEGPWLGGSDIQDVDTDDDGLEDGYEIYYGSNPVEDSAIQSDADEDGLNLLEERQAGTDPVSPDTDGDGLCDGGRGLACNWPGTTTNVGGQPGERDYGSDPRDADSDDDQLTDGQEAQRWDSGASGVDQDVDGDGLGGITDPDNDGDLLSDGDEVYQHDTDPGDADTDGDRLDDGRELLQEDTDPLLPDTDEDGLDDGTEVLDEGTLPLVQDTDGDELLDGEEVNRYLTEPLLVDTDGDGMPDGWEVQHDLQPLNDADADEDPDGDGVRIGEPEVDEGNAGEDFFEGLTGSFTNLDEYRNGTDPRNADTDGDGMHDGWEVFFYLDPLSPLDEALDFDDDGLDNLGEFQWRLIPVCLMAFQNCWDHEQDFLSGNGGDLWRDGDEVAYWDDERNDEQNIVIPLPTVMGVLDAVDATVDDVGEARSEHVDPLLGNLLDQLPNVGPGQSGGVNRYVDAPLDMDVPFGPCLTPMLFCSADIPPFDFLFSGASADLPEEVNASWPGLLYDPDAQLDSDGDGSRNVADVDSDNDGLLDGEEKLFLGTFPELEDSDCLETPCTSSLDVANRFDERQGTPGTGDGIGDGDEYDAWLAISEFAMWVDYDGDGFFNNLLDPDSDNDGLLDGEEFLVWSSHPGMLDSDRDGLNDTEEVREFGTQPGNWDTDGDGLPDGYEIEFGFDPLNPVDGGLDSDGDSYNPHGEITPELAWTNRAEYEWMRPVDWSEPMGGTWMGGTGPLDQDTDGDSVPDGVEVAQGSDPLDPESFDPRGADVNRDPGDSEWEGVMRSDPSNEDLDQLHPVNQQYLEDKEARAVAALEETAEGNESAALDFIADLADEALDLVWEQEVLDPLRPTVERVPYVQTVRDSPAIIRGLREPVRDVTDYVDRGVGILEPAVMETVTSGSPQPLIDAADQIGPYVADAPLVSEALPTPVRRELQEFTVPTPQEIIAGIEDLQSSPMAPVSEGLGLVRELIPTTTPMPTFTADTLYLSGLTDVYETMTTISQATGTPHAATVSDVPFYTVLVNHTGDLHIESPLALGEPTPIDVDGDPNTGDISGFDVEVELTLDQPEDPNRPGLPVLPGFRITKLDASESYEAALHAFVQIPGEETVAVLGVNQHAAALHPANAAHADLPDNAWLRLTDYKPATEGDAFTTAGLNETRIGFAVQSTTPENRPLLVQGGLVPFDVTSLDKEPLPGEDHSAGFRFSAIPATTLMEVHDVTDDAVNRLDVAWTASQVLDVEVVTVDKSNDAGLRQDVKLTGLPTSVELSQTTVRDTQERHVTYTADSAMSGMVFYSRHESPAQGESRRVYVNVTDVPASFALDVEPTRDHYQYTASSAFTEAVFELSPDGDACFGATAVHYLVMEESGCTVVRVRGLQDFQADLAEQDSSASWTRTPDTGGLAIVVEGDTPFLLAASTWPGQGDFRVTEDATGEQSFSWLGSATIADLFVTGDTRSDAGGVYYRFDVTDLPTSLAGFIDTENRVYDIDANTAITEVDFAYTTKPTREALALGTDFLAIDKDEAGMSVSGRIHGFRNAHVDLANGDLLHVDSDISTPQPLRVLYQGPDGAVDAYLSNVPQDVEFDYAYDIVQDRRELEYEASAAIIEATLTGNLDDVFFDFHLQGLPTVAGFTADNTNHEWTVAANAPITQLDAVYVKNQGTYQAPASGDYVVFYDEPTNSGVSSDTIVYAAHLTGFQSATISGGEDEFHVESVRAAAQPFVLRYGRGLDYVEIDVNDLPTHLDASYQAGALTYTASSAVNSAAFDVHLEENPGTAVKIAASIDNVPTSFEASWPASDADPIHATITHNGATPMGPMSLEWWDLRSSTDGLGLTPYLGLSANSIPDNVSLDYNEASKHFTFQASHAGSPATLVNPLFWSVPSGTSTVEVPGAVEYAVMENANDGRGAILVSFEGIESVDFQAPSNGLPGWFEAKKQAAGSLHAEIYDDSTNTTARLTAAGTPASMRLDLALDRPAALGSINSLDVSWTASAPIPGAALLFETMDVERGTVKQASFSSPQIPGNLEVHFRDGQIAWFEADAPVDLKGTYGPQSKADYPARQGSDYAFVESDGGISSLSVDLTGFQNVTLDIENHFAHMQRSSTRDVELGVDLVDLTLAMSLASPPAGVDVWWQQPNGRLLEYEASSLMDELVFSMEAINASTNLPMVLQARIVDVPLAVLVEAPEGGPFRIDTPFGGFIGDAYVEVGLDGTGTVLDLPWSEGASLVQNETEDVVKATARIVGLEDFQAHGSKDFVAGTFSAHAVLNRASSLPGQSFGFHVQSPQNDTRVSGVSLPEDLTLEVVKETGLDFLLDWSASGPVQDLSVQTARDSVVANEVTAPSVPSQVYLRAWPDSLTRETVLSYTASAGMPDLVASVQANGNQFQLHAWDVPTSILGRLSEDYKEGHIEGSVESVGGFDASFHPLNGAPLDLDVDAQEFVHIDLSEATGRRGHVRIEELDSVTWVFDNASKSYGVSLYRGVATMGHDLDARVFLDEGALAMGVEGLPVILEFGADLDTALGTAENDLLAFVEPGEFLAARWSAASLLPKVSVDFTPAEETGGLGPVHVLATNVPTYLELHASRQVDGGVDGSYTANGRVGSLLLDAVHRGTRVYADLLDAPSDLSFSVSGDKRSGIVTVPLGIGFGALDFAVHPASQVPPALPPSMSVLSSLAIDAQVEGQTAMSASFPGNVDIQRVEWSKPVDSDEVRVVFDRNPLAARPSFGVLGEFPELTVSGTLSELPTRIEYESKREGHHNAAIEGGVVDGSMEAAVHVVSSKAGAESDFWVNASGVPSWIQVDADVQEGGDASIVYEASASLARLEVEGTHSGTRIDAVVQGVPSAFVLNNNGSGSNGVATTTGNLTLPNGGSIESIEAALYPDGGVALVPVDSQVLQLQPSLDAEGSWVDAVYFQVTNLTEASWDLTKTVAPSCSEDDVFDATFSVAFASPTDLRVLSEGDCDKYLDIDATRVPSSLSAVIQKGFIQYDVTDTAKTENIQVYMEGFSSDGPDNRAVESLDLWLNDLKGPVTFRIVPAEENNGRTLVRILGGSVGLARATMDLGDRAPNADPRLEDPLDLAVDLDADYLEFRMANDAVHRITAPDSQLSIYQDGAKEFSIYAELWGVDSFIYSGGQDDLDPCRLEIDQFEYNTLQSNHDVVLAYDVEKESACAEKDGVREQFVVELTDIPLEFSITDAYFLEKDLEMNIHTPQGSLGKLRHHKPLAAGGEVRTSTVLEGIPQTSNTFVKFKSQGIEVLHLAIQPDTGSVDRIKYGLSTRGEEFVAGFELEDVNLFVQVDLSGDTRYDGVPTYFFMDTGGQFTTGSVRIYNDYYGVGLTLLGVWAHDAQIYKHKPTAAEVFMAGLVGGPAGAAAESIPIRANGAMVPVLGASSLAVEVKIGSHWLSVPEAGKTLFDW